MFAGGITVILVIWGWWLFVPRNIYPASIYVEPGDSFAKVIVKLKDREVISQPWIFSKAAIILGIDRKIIPGRYDFGRKTSHYTVMQRLKLGKIARLKVTVPEGYTLTEISELLDQKCGTSRPVFDSLVRDSLFLLSLGIDAGFAEGYLFPETYNFQWGISAREAIATMVSELYRRLDTAILRRADSMGYSIDDLLTMASIVEAEGHFRDEFSLIASVYRNRLEIGMKLQADPTVIYGMGRLDRDLLISDYKFPSTYNTYLHAGLPPTPICSPGMDAIMASLYPAQSDYLFFVADGSGRHVFNVSYQDHLRDTRAIKRRLRGLTR